jgi:signal transduction histidine kinase
VRGLWRRLAFEPGSGEDDGWERPGPTPAQQRTDVLVGLAMVAATICSALLAFSVGVTVGSERPSMAESLAWCVAVSLPLVVRRRFPLTTLLVVATAFIGLQARLVPESQLSQILLFLALFTAGAWGQDRTLTRFVRLGVIVVMFAWLAVALSVTAWGQVQYGERADGPIPPAIAEAIYIIVLNIGYFAAGLGFGNMAWNQARQQQLLAERNAELAAERDLRARRAVLAERVRIARELHDVVAHHVSVMGIQAAAARRVLDRDPDLTRATLESVEESGRTAVAEMHRLLAVLRSADAPVSPEAATDADADLPPTEEPVPGVEGVKALVTGVAEAGPRTDLTIVGEPVPLPPSVSVSAYRVVQEALTNALRHAGASHVDVRVRYLDAVLEVEVVDDGRGSFLPAPTRTSTAGAGMGLVGMRERVALHGGELEAGPRRERGYRVRARFPLPAAAS